MIRLIILFAALMATGCATTPNQSEPTVPLTFSMHLGEITTPPENYVVMCSPLCPTQYQPPVIIRLDEASWEVLQSANRRVNSSNRDRESWEVARAKAYWLTNEANVDRRTLSLAIGFTAMENGYAAGERRVVLLARTTRGTYILDDRSDQVIPLHASPYFWYKIEDFATGRWHYAQNRNLQAESDK